jgi:hypothetical protein
MAPPHALFLEAPVPKLVFARFLLPLGVLLALSAVFASPAAAQALDPLNRLHLGASMVPGPVPFGLTGGFESRLTRLLFVDAGGFGSFGVLESSLLPEDHSSADALLLRHGILLAPGLRIPHVQPEAFSFDILLRGGMAALWLADLDRDTSRGLSIYANEVAGLAGLDLCLQRGMAGLRLSWRQLIYAPFLDDVSDAVPTTAPLFSLEGQVQFRKPRGP